MTLTPTFTPDLDPTIPSAFQRFDTTATQDDSYVDVRLLQAQKGNQNILLARRHRRLISCWQSQIAGLGYIWEGISSPEYGSGTIVWFQPLIVSRHIKEVEVVVRASCSASASAELWPVIGGASQPSDDLKISVGTSMANYSSTIPVPEQSRIGDGRFVMLYLYLGLTGWGSVKGSGPYTVSAFGSNEDGSSWIEDASAGAIGAVGDAAVFSDNEIQPTSVRAITGTRTHLDGKLTKSPAIGTDTVDYYSARNVTIDYVGVYEAAITDFSAETITT